MKKMLILNLTRMGDLIQTTPVLIGLKSKHPSSHATLVVSEAFRSICDFIPWVDEIVSFPMGRLGELLKRGEIVRAYRETLEVLEAINAVEYDVALNFTHSRVSAFLITLVRAREVGGFRIDDEGASYIEKDWHRFFFNIVQSRPFSPFHICDLHLFMAGLGPCGSGVRLHVSPSEMERAGRILREAGVPSGKLLVGVHPGASESDRTWGAENFARLVGMISERKDASILLFGSGKEKEVCDFVQQRGGGNVFNFAGRTSLQDLVPLISHCHLLVSNDTGPLHIATAVGTKAVGIFLKTAYFRQTGPYGEGHYVVEPKIPCHPCRFGTDCPHLSCRDCIPVEGIHELVEMLLRGDEPERLPAGGHFERMQVYRSFFDSEDGALDYRPLVRRPIQERDLLTYLYRYVFVNSLGRPEEGFREHTLNWLIEKLVEFYDTSSIEDVIDGFDDKKAVLGWMLSLLEEARLASSEVASELAKPEPDFEKIDGLLERIRNIDREVIERGSAFHQLVALVRLFRLEKEAVVGDDPLFLAERTTSVYERFLSRGRMFMEILSMLKKRAESSKITCPVR